MKNPNPNMKRERGQRLRQARKDAGLSQKELGEAVGKTQQSITRMETGRYEIEADVLVFLFQEHGIHPMTILFNR